MSELWESFAFSEKLKEFIGEKAFASLNRFHSDDFINSCLEKLRGEGINVITAINPLFPKLLLQPEVNAPLVLYYRGDINVFKTECVAVVGTRACSSYGKLMSKVVAVELAENGVIRSQRSCDGYRRVCSRRGIGRKGQNHSGDGGRT